MYGEIGSTLQMMFRWRPLIIGDGGRARPISSPQKCPRSKRNGQNGQTCSIAICYHNWIIIWSFYMAIENIAIWYVYHNLSYVLIILFPFNHHFVCFNPYDIPRTLCHGRKKHAQRHVGSVGIPPCPWRSKTPQVPPPQSLHGRRRGRETLSCVCVGQHKCWVIGEPNVYVYIYIYTRGDWGSPMPSAAFECQHVKKTAGA